MKKRLMLALATLVWVMWLSIACGSSDEQTSNGVAEVAVDEVTVVTIGDRPELRGSTRPSATFIADDFVEAGWKKNKEYDLDTLPEAEAALFGFFNRKDIELRFYPSHEIAMSAGKDSAEQAIATEKVSGRGAGFSSVTLYGAYLIAGNVVMLCEFSVQDCTDLLDEIPQWNSRRVSLRSQVFYFCVALIAIMFAYGCGSSGSGTEDGHERNAEAETDVNVIGDRLEISAWTRPNTEYSYEDFIAAGWKQRQIYDVATLPSALEARYGFFNRRGC